MKTTKTFSTIKEWSEEDRPREKLVQQGAHALSNAELLAILINTGTAQRTALDIANEILSSSENNLIELTKKTLNDLKQIKGIGSKKAVTLIASLELGKRRQLAHSLEKLKLDSSKKIFDLLRPYFMDKKSEEFYVVYLNHGQKAVFIQQLHRGGITQVQIDIRLIFRKALELSEVTKIVIAHNHPSGELRPSEADKLVTARVKDLGSMFEIRLIDHLIIYENQYYSFADEGML